MKKRTRLRMLAVRKLPGRLARLAERDAQLEEVAAQMAANKPQFEE